VSIFIPQIYKAAENALLNPLTKLIKTTLSYRHCGLKKLTIKIFNYKTFFFFSSSWLLLHLKRYSQVNFLTPHQSWASAVFLYPSILSRFLSKTYNMFYWWWVERFFHAVKVSFVVNFCAYEDKSFWWVLSDSWSVGGFQLWPLKDFIFITYLNIHVMC